MGRFVFLEGHREFLFQPWLSWHSNHWLQWAEGAARDFWNYPGNHHQEWCPSEEGYTLVNSRDPISIRWAAWGLSVGGSSPSEDSWMWLGIQIFDISAENSGCWASLCFAMVEVSDEKCGKGAGWESQLPSIKAQSSLHPLLCIAAGSTGGMFVQWGCWGGSWWVLNIQNIPLMRQEC